MAFDKHIYIKLPENGIAGQDAKNKQWYCKELPFTDAQDFKTRAKEVIEVLNELNKDIIIKDDGKKKKKDKK